MAFDFSVVSGSSKLFLERSGIVPTYRGPAPTTVPGDNPIHDAALTAPLPLADFVSPGEPPPDTAMADDPWHLGSEE